MASVSRKRKAAGQGPPYLAMHDGVAQRCDEDPLQRNVDLIQEVVAESGAPLLVPGVGLGNVGLGCGG